MIKLIKSIIGKGTQTIHISGNKKTIIQNNVSGNNNIVVCGDLITFNGESVKMTERNIVIQVDGDVGNIEADICSSLTINGNVTGDVVNKMGDIKCNDVTGNIKSSMGNVECENIGGNVKTSMGKIKYKK